MKNIELITKKVLEYANNFTTEQAKDSAIPKKYKDLMLSKKFGCDNVDDFIFDLTDSPEIFVEILGEELALSKDFVEDVNLTNFLKNLAKK